MSELNIALEATAFQPGDFLAGTVSWRLDDTPRAVELRLFWFTRGKGTEDTEIVTTVRFDPPSVTGSEPFRIRLPDSPYSFSGKLISLIWSLELVVEPMKEMYRREIVVAPGGREVPLDTVPDREPNKRLRWRMKTSK